MTTSAESEPRRQRLELTDVLAGVFALVVAECASGVREPFSFYIDGHDEIIFSVSSTSTRHTEVGTLVEILGSVSSYDGPKDAAINLTLPVEGRNEGFLTTLA